MQLGDTRVATHAAVTLTVDAARILRRPQHASLVNAVLRRSLREQPAVDATDEVRFNHPGWMLRRLQHDWPSHWQRIVAANDERAPMWLRVNLRRGSRDDYLRELSGEAVEGPVATTEDGLDAALCLGDATCGHRAPGFRRRARVWYRTVRRSLPPRGYWRAAAAASLTRARRPAEKPGICWNWRRRTRF
ncbi:MAG: hypothetical protein U5K38_10740 [Woeseiaceae bacterium]|nr:hypothetical protein [Woeseiaceae bacterium]